MARKMVERCPFCSNGRTLEKSKIISSINKKEYTLNSCVNCGLQYFTPLIFEDVYTTEAEPEYCKFHEGREKIPFWSNEVGKYLKRINYNFEGKRILEIGAGDGINFTLLADRFHINADQYYAVEMDEKSLQAARKKGVVHAYHAYFDSEFASRVTEKFDLVLATEVLEHQTDPREFIKNCTSMLDENGIIVITVPNRRRFFYRFRKDMPPHHFLLFDEYFFKRNFGRRVVACYDFTDDSKTIVASAKVLSRLLLKEESYFPLFISAVPFFRLLDYIQGEGLLAVLKK